MVSDENGEGIGTRIISTGRIALETLQQAAERAGEGEE